MMFPSKDHVTGAASLGMIRPSSTTLRQVFLMPLPLSSCVPFPRPPGDLTQVLCSNS